MRKYLKMDSLAAIILYACLMIAIFSCCNLMAQGTRTSNILQSAYFNDDFARSAIPILRKDGNEVLVPHGTGFMVSYKNKAFLVSNRHVFQDRQELIIALPLTNDFESKLNLEGATQIVMEGHIWEKKGNRIECMIEMVTSSGKANWISYDTTGVIDVAVMEIFPPITYLENDSAAFACNVRTMLEEFFAPDSMVRHGQSCFMIGFPSGYGCFNPDSLYTLNGTVYMKPIDPIIPLINFGYVVYRHPHLPELWLDKPAFGGNSGSPVLGRLSYVSSITGNTMFNDYLIGIVYKKTIDYYGRGETMDMARVIVASKILELIKRAYDS